MHLETSRGAGDVEQVVGQSRSRSRLTTCAKLNSQPSKIGSSDIDTLRTYGFNEEQIFGGRSRRRLAKFANTVAFGLRTVPDVHNRRIAEELGRVQSLKAGSPGENSRMSFFMVSWQFPVERILPLSWLYRHSVSEPLPLPLETTVCHPCARPASIRRQSRAFRQV